VEVEDWDSGELVRLPLDPRKTAVEAAEALYKQARKQRRAVLQVAPLLAAARQELAYLAEVEVMLQQLEGGAHLAALQVRQWWAAGRCCRIDERQAANTMPPAYPLPAAACFPRQRFPWRC
jgi:hypothetical protein